MTNRAMPALVKVGYSNRDPTTRAAELDNAGLPYPYFVDYEIHVHDAHLLEQKVHSSLKVRHATHENREWFRVSVAEAVSAIRTAAGGEFIYERPERGGFQRKKYDPKRRAKIEFRCGGCPTTLRVPADKTGVVRCPTCGYLTRVSSWLDGSRVVKEQ